MDMAKRASQQGSTAGSHMGSERAASKRRTSYAASMDNGSQKGDGAPQLQQRPSDSATVEPIEEVRAPTTCACAAVRCVVLPPTACACAAVR